MARKEIKIFMDAKEAASFLKTIDWSWLFGFLSERYNVSLSPHKELKDNGAAIIKVEWPDELIEKCGMMADVFSSVKLVTFDSYFKEIVEYDEDKFNEEREAWLTSQSDKDVQLSRLRWRRQGTDSCAEHLPSLYAV